ncbi:ABC transporter substrate-binding protein [Leptolyngbya sp. FACHB-261]|uniref:ABC transporter substrate-binding protein n=1 Tax=Leptolyngbya sp. FACHB-261 TaxID=2692806 RepID=UPI0016859DF7|nr:ABC transporter substrate-binding protein [Leptolyngbya sp. FACHB-261]MBD2100836.1 ABC transporter substrate-binding protein [Leptolyngbya sp. FACHB-261]
MLKRLFPFLALFTLTLGLLLACGGPPQPTNSSTIEPEASTAGTSSVLVFGRGSDSPSLDPANASDFESFIVTRNLYETLVALKDGTTDIEPELAESWQISPDGKTYSFKLRQGVKFHDGTDLNADAVVTNYERWLNKEGGGTYDYFQTVFGGFAGEPDLLTQSVKAVDPYTVEFQLKRPFGPFLGALSLPAFGIVSPKALVSGQSINDKPVGTGPFRFKQWLRNETITLEKFPEYWRQGEPRVAQLIYQVVPEDQARLTALNTQQIDLMDGLNPDQLSQVQGQDQLQVFKRPSFSIGYLGFNVTKPPFDKVQVRQAISYAVNKQAVVQAFYAGNAQAAINPMPPSIPGYANQIQDYDYNPDKAKQLLTEAGLPNGFDTEIWISSKGSKILPKADRMAEAFQQDLAKVGIRAKIVDSEWATFLADTRAGKQQMFLLGWSGDYADAESFLGPLFNGRNIPGNNRFRYNNPRVNKLLDDALVLTDEAERRALYVQAQEILKQDAPLVPLVHVSLLLAGSKDVQGYKPSPVGSDSLARVSVGNT